MCARCPLSWVTRTFSREHPTAEISDFARDLRVRYVLEGSVRHAGNRMRITAQLIDAAVTHHVWAEKYDVDTADLFSIQDDIAQKVSASIQAEVRIYEGASISTSIANRSFAE